MLVESLSSQGMQFHPWLGNENTIQVIGKPGVDQFAGTPHPEISGAYPAGRKVRVVSTENSIGVLTPPVTIVREAASGNAFHTASVLSERGTMPVQPHVVLSSQVGQDRHGEVFKEALANKSEIISDVSECPGRTPNAVVFPTERDRIILTESTTAELPVFEGSIVAPEFIYLTSVGGSNWHETYKSVTEYALKNDISLAVSPGTANYDSLLDDSELGRLQQSILYETVAAADILFGNKEEIGKLIAGKGYVPHEDPVQRLLQAKELLGSDQISMTDGGDGSYFMSHDNSILMLPVYQTEKAVPELGREPEEEKLEFTGAGDAYVGGFMKGYMAGESDEDCMRMGALAAHAVIHEQGVQPGVLARHGVDKTFRDTTQTFKPVVLFPLPPQEPQEYELPLAS